MSRMSDEKFSGSGEKSTGDSQLDKTPFMPRMVRRPENDAIAYQSSVPDWEQAGDIAFSCNFLIL